MPSTRLARRSLLALGATSSATAFLPTTSRSQTILPDKALRIVVGFPAGGGAALMAQFIAVELERRVGRHVTVDHKPGDSGVYAGEYLKTAPADGSVIAFMPSTTLAVKAVAKNFPFDPQKDFASLGLAGTFQTALATSRTIAPRSLAEYVSWVKENADERKRFGITLADPLLAIYCSMIGRELGLSFKPVGFRGGAPLVKELEIGGIPAGAGGLTTFLEYHRGRKINMLATSGKKRSAVAKDVPTATELGYPNLLIEEWYGFFAPAGVPVAIQAEWNRQLLPVLATEELRAKLGQFGLEVDGSTREEAVERLANLLTNWKMRVAASGLKPDN